MKKISVLNFDIGNIAVRVSMGGFAHIGDKGGATVHSHVDFEYHAVMRGGSEIEFDKEKVTLEENDVILIFPDVFHKFLKGEMESAVLSFQFSVKKKSRGIDYYRFISEKLAEKEYLVIRDNRSAVEFLHKVAANSYSKNPFAEIEIKACLSLIMTQLFTVLSADNEGDAVESDDNDCDSRAYIIDEYFNEHYMEHVSISALSELLYLGEIDFLIIS